jgi:FkbM family methyltransferase
LYNFVSFNSRVGLEENHTSLSIKHIGKSGPQLAVSIPVLPLDENGKFLLPPGVKKVWFDVGAHKSAMYTRESLLTQPDLAIIAFEPMYDMWGQLSTAYAHDRLFSIPAAVSDGKGFAKFRRAETDMCSSLKDADPNVDIWKWPGGCSLTARTFLVPVISLEEIIELIPLETVEFVKVDAQGSDFDVLKSAGKSLERINSIVVEVQINHVLYKDAKTEQEFVDYMGDRGFEVVTIEKQGKNEENIHFHNKKYPKPTNLPLDDLLSGKRPVKV